MTLGDMSEEKITQLRERLKPYILRRTKAQVFEKLPEKVEVRQLAKHAVAVVPRPPRNRDSLAARVSICERSWAHR